MSRYLLNLILHVAVCPLVSFEEPLVSILSTGIMIVATTPARFFNNLAWFLEKSAGLIK